MDTERRRKKTQIDAWSWTPPAEQRDYAEAHLNWTASIREPGGDERVTLSEMPAVGQ